MSIPTYCVGGFSFLLACSCIIAVTCENRHSESWDLICHCHFDFQFCACWQCAATWVSCDVYRQHICCFFQFFFHRGNCTNSSKVWGDDHQVLVEYLLDTDLLHMWKEGDKVSFFLGSLCLGLKSQSLFLSYKLVPCICFFILPKMGSYATVFFCLADSLSVWSSKVHPCA